MAKPVVISEKHHALGIQYTNQTYEFENGHRVPIFNVETIAGLNQVVGYMKFLNRDYGRVYSRGQAQLYKTLKPNLARKTTKPENPRLAELVSKVRQDKYLSKSIGLSTIDRHQQNLVVEALLQHYGVDTYCLDAVDNHWIALWFGHYLYQGGHDRGGREYARYTKRQVDYVRLAKNMHPACCSMRGSHEETYYQYVLLIAVDGFESRSGVIVGEDVTTIDLRQALPSVFLRPHAQHGVILRKNLPKASGAHLTSDDWDMASNVVAILRMRIDVVEDWLGDGSMLAQRSLIPSPLDDQGYQDLLQRDDLFSAKNQRITYYTY